MNNTLTTTPQFDFSSLDRRTDLADSTKRKYRGAWLRALASGVDLTNPASVYSYAVTLPASGQLHLSAMMKHQTQELERAMKSGLDMQDVTPEIIAQMTATFWKLESLRDSIPTRATKGTKGHIWLSQPEVDRITSLPNRATLRGRRDYIILALLLGAGLRCEEMEALTFDTLLRLPNGNSYRDVLTITGKGDVMRTVPISPLLSQRLREWHAEIGSLTASDHAQAGGQVARSVNKAGKLGESLSDRAVFDIVRQYGALIEHPDLDPHDFRRSFGRLGYEATRDVMLIRDLLGHKNVKTTQDYIGLHIKLDVTASDYIIKPSEFYLQVSGD